MMLDSLQSKKEESKREKSQRRIFLAAIHVIAERGYHNTRISDIAKEAGVAYGLVYHYFGSKENIMYKILDEITKKFSEKIDKINLENISTLEKLAKISDYMFDTYLASKDVIKLLVNEIVKEPKVDKDLFISKRILERIREIIQTGKEKKEIDSDIDPKIYTLVFFGSIQMLLVSLVSDYYQSETSSQTIKKFRQQFKKMLCKEN